MKIVFFDLETTGLPVSWKEKYTNKANWPYIVQLAYIISYQEDEISEEQDFILKPEGFIIPSQSTRIHGVSNEVALKTGVSRNQVLHLFAAHLKNSDYIVAHNAEFDINVLRCEFLRNNIEDPFKADLNIICTMKKSKDFCKLSSTYGDYKWPSLQELYSKLFKKYFNDAHNAKNDVRATFECFWKLSELNVITLKNAISKYQPNIDKKFLFSFFLERDDIFYDLLSNYYPLDEDLLTLLEPNLDWYAVSRNTEINWTIDLIEKFQDKWDMDAEYGGHRLGEIKWYGLSSNPRLPWSIELIQMFKDKFAFKYPGDYSLGELSKNEALPWSYGLIIAFLDDWDWEALSSSSFLPWDVWFIEQFKDKWIWDELSKNESLPWSILMVCKFKDYWNWPLINKMYINNKIDINDKEVITAYFDNILTLKQLAYLPLNEAFVDLAIDSFEFKWDILYNCGVLPWSARLIKKYRYKTDSLWSFEVHNTIYWSVDLLKEFEDTLIWSHFAHNENVDFSINFFNEFEHRINFNDSVHDSYKINWKYLIENKSIVWNEELLNRYYNQLKNKTDFWSKLSYGDLKINWSKEIIVKYYSDLDWRGLSGNENLLWTEELIRQYEDYWDWYRLYYNSALKWTDNLINDYSYKLTEYYLDPDSKKTNKSDNESNFDFLKNNKNSSYSLYKVWELSKQELCNNLIIDIHNSII